MAADEAANEAIIQEITFMVSNGNGILASTSLLYVKKVHRSENIRAPRRPRFFKAVPWVLQLATKLTRYDNIEFK